MRFCLCGGRARALFDGQATRFLLAAPEPTEGNRAASRASEVARPELSSARKTLAKNASMLQPLTIALDAFKRLWALVTLRYHVGAQ